MIFQTETLPYQFMSENTWESLIASTKSELELAKENVRKLKKTLHYLTKMKEQGLPVPTNGK